MVLIHRSNLQFLTKSIFATGSPEVYEAYSAYDQALELFDSAEHVDTLMKGLDCTGKTSFDLAIWYPDCGGRVEKEHVQIKVKLPNNPTFRYTVGGWGIFRFQGQFQANELVACRIAVNSHKRALKWEVHYSE